MEKEKKKTDIIGAEESTGKISAKMVAYAGIMTGVAIVLMIVLEFPIPFLPKFLKVDLSSIPLLVLGFAFGTPGILITWLAVLTKDLLHLAVTSTGGVGELADFICSSALIVPSALIYSKKRTKKGAVLALAVGTVCMTIMAMFANKFILLPFYAKLMPLDKIFEMSGMFINSTWTYIIYGVVPFNILKGLILSLITMLVYKRVSVIIKK